MGKYTKKDYMIFLIMAAVAASVVIYWMCGLCRDYPILAVAIASVSSVYYAGLIMVGIDLYRNAD